MLVSEARAFGVRQLEAGSDSPRLDTDVLLAAALGTSRAGIFARRAEALPAAVEERFRRMISRRRAGEPVAYVVGLKSFRLIDLVVDARVLVPRPETEMLVEIGLLALQRMPGRRRVVDVGTGSGAIALALADELRSAGRADVEVIASDISHEALRVAEENRQRLGLVRQVALEQRDLLTGHVEPFDVVLTNLPYLREDQRHRSTIREPDLALYAGADGFDLYRRLLDQAGPLLGDGGVMACEIDPDQAALALELAQGLAGSEARVLTDPAGRERVLLAGDVDMVRTVAETSGHGARSGTS